MSNGPRGSNCSDSPAAVLRLRSQCRIGRSTCRNTFASLPFRGLSRPHLRRLQRQRHPRHVPRPGPALSAILPDPLSAEHAGRAAGAVGGDAAAGSRTCHCARRRPTPGALRSPMRRRKRSSSSPDRCSWRGNCGRFSSQASEDRYVTPLVRLYHFADSPTLRRAAISAVILFRTHDQFIRWETMVRPSPPETRSMHPLLRRLAVLAPLVTVRPGRPRPDRPAT